MVDRRSEAEGSVFKRPKHLSLADIAYQVLVEAIVNQQFQPGAQINIDTLGRELNMSNTPVREALMRVTGERLVVQKSNRGFVVTDILSPQELQEMFDVRYLLEIYALNTGDLSEEAVDGLDALAQQMTVTKGGLVYQDFKDYLHADHLFHQSIVALPQNGLLVKSWEALHVHLHLSRLYTGVGLFDRSESAVEHIDIVAALRQGDREQAVARLSQHIRDVEQRLLAFLQAI
jgi:DNA-binding GntR family transcriptional regulator